MSFVLTATVHNTLHSTIKVKVSTGRTLIVEPNQKHVISGAEGSKIIQLVICPPDVDGEAPRPNTPLPVDAARPMRAAAIK